MTGLKQYIQQNSIQRVAFHRFYTSIKWDINADKSAAAYDVFYLGKYLQDECGIEPIIISINSRKPKNSPFKVIRYDEVDYSDIDLIIFQPNSFILFGGVWKSYQIDSLNLYLNEYQGTSMILYNDPAVLWSNPYELIVKYNKTRVSHQNEFYHIEPDETAVERFDSKKIVGLFIGNNFEQFKSHTNERGRVLWPTEVVNIKLSEWIMYNQFNTRTTNIIETNKRVEDIKYDILYYGSDRKGFRKKLLNKLFKEDISLQKLWIGYDPQYLLTDNIDKQLPEKLQCSADKCLVSIVVGDSSHNNNIITYRLFENALMGIISVVHTSYDTEMKIFNNDTLRELSYFNTTDELVDIVNKLKSNQQLYEKILKMQLESIRQLAKEYNNESNLNLRHSHAPQLT